jgi:single-stranded DNA-binding protein
VESLGGPRFVSSSIAKSTMCEKGPICSVFRAICRPLSDEADFFRIKAWNSQAEAAGDHLGKGRRIAVEGSLRQDVYEKDGEERKAVSVVAKRLEYL